MRISNLQIFSEGLRNILDAQRAVARTQEELATGRRVITPADDPSAAALALKIEQDQALTRQYLVNIDVAERELSQEETQLQGVESILIRLRELAILAGNDALTNSERQAIISEAEERRDELLGIFNTRAASGEYLFSGFQGKTRPFVERPYGAVDYVADEGRRYLQIAPAVDVEVRDDGKGLFVDIPAANKTFQTRPLASNTGQADIDTGRIVDQALFDAVYPDDLVISFDNPPDTYSVSRRDNVSGAVTPLVSGQPYTSGEAIEIEGVEVRIAGTPAAGDGFVIGSSPSQSLLATVQRFVDGLRAAPDTPAGSEERARVVAETLDNLDLTEQHVTGARAEIGSRLNVVDSVREQNLDLELLGQELLSDLVAVDFEEAASRLSFQITVLQAAQQSFVAISNLSLFNFLR